MSAKHTPELDPHREAIRARGLPVNPYRIGCEVGRRGEDLPSPYAKGSRGDRLYRDGIKYGRQWLARANAAIAAAKGQT